MTKNIVICADGTGNAEGRRIGTNVGRIFKAIDLTDDNQVAFYDDGVGTEENKYLRAIGGAFGWGMKENIIDCYEFLCRNYEQDDQIYIFGFSRGSYTARAVAGLICKMGVIDVHKPDAAPGKDLRTLAKKAYGVYRKNCGKDDGDDAAAAAAVSAFKADHCLAHQPEIRFIGIWDSVDAVGVPIDEIATAIHKVFPYRFSNSKLSKHVRKGCHVVAIDDQRHTFHPDLWVADETQAEDGNPRIEQVFFAGMHSNVGGGYPKDELAYVSLRWMMVKAAMNGLEFISSVRMDYELKANPHAKIYDSRAGLAMFYRFKPRNIHEMAKARGIENVQVHESVAERLFGNVVDYGPANLRSKFTIVNDIGEPSKNYQSEQKLISDNEDQLRTAFTIAADIAWCRRAVYVGVLLSIFGVLALPAFVDLDPHPNCVGAVCALEPFLGVILTVTGGLAAPWTAALSASPIALFIFFAVIVGAYLLHRRLKPAMSDSGLQGWHLVRGLPSDIEETWYTREAYRIRRSKLANKIAKLLREELIPFAFIFLLVVVVGWFVGTPIYHLSTGKNTACLAADGETSSDTSTRNPCINTGIELVSGQDYAIQLRADLGWVDKTIDATPPVGFQSSHGGASMHLAVPMRRHLEQPWFQLMYKIGVDGEARPVTESPQTITADNSGKLFIYVNDAICYHCISKWAFYTNNIGEICGRVSGMSINPERFGECGNDWLVYPTLK